MKPVCLSFFFFVCLLKSSHGQIPITAGTYFPPNTPLTEDGVPVLNRKYSRNDAVHYPGPQALDHYSSFVNDPYVSTEDLGSIISSRPRPSRPQSQRQRPELRSGTESYHGDRIRWSAPFQPSSSSYYRSTSSYTETPQEQSGRYHSNSNTYTYTNPTRTPYYGNGNDEWEVADKGDNHITYRRRVTSTRQWQSPPSVQRFDTQRGEVSARVVDMRTNDRDDDYYGRRGGDTRRTNTDAYSYRSQPARPETRSLDYNPSIFPTNTRSATGNANVDAYWQQRRQGSSSSSSASSWPSSSSGSSYSGYGSSNYYDRRQDSYNPQYRPAPRFEPNYPILNDRATAAKAGVPNTVVITV